MVEAYLSWKARTSAVSRVLKEHADKCHRRTCARIRGKQTAQCIFVCTDVLHTVSAGSVFSSELSCRGWLRTRYRNWPIINIFIVAFLRTEDFCIFSSHPSRPVSL